MFLKLIKSFDQDYQISQASNLSMQVLGNFLIDDGIRASLFFEAWVNDEQQDVTAGNLCLLKKNNSMVLITYLFGEEDEHFIQLPKESFNKLMEAIKSVYKDKPREIIINIDEGREAVVQLNA